MLASLFEFRDLTESQLIWSLPLTQTGQPLSYTNRDTMHLSGQQLTAPDSSNGPDVCLKDRRCFLMEFTDGQVEASE